MRARCRPTATELSERDPPEPHSRTGPPQRGAAVPAGRGQGGGAEGNGRAPPGQRQPAPPARPRHDRGARQPAAGPGRQARGGEKARLGETLPAARNRQEPQAGGKQQPVAAGGSDPQSNRPPARPLTSRQGRDVRRRSAALRAGLPAAGSGRGEEGRGGEGGRSAERLTSGHCRGEGLRGRSRAPPVGECGSGLDWWRSFP